MEFLLCKKKYKLNHIQKSWHCKQCCTHQHRYTVCQSFPPCKGQQNMTGDQPRQNSAKYRYVIVCFKLDWDHAVCMWGVCMCTRTLKHSLHVVLPLANPTFIPIPAVCPTEKNIQVFLSYLCDFTWSKKQHLEAQSRSQKWEER